MKKFKKKSGLQQINFALYVLLLIMTPFLLLQNYLQAAIGIASNAKWEMGSLSIPYTVMIGLALLCALLIYVRKKLKLRHLIYTAVILFLFWLGQQTTDYYFGHKYYELQHNWHYLAYSVFAIISWRFWRAKGKTTAKIMLNTMLVAFSASLLDEIAQVPLSNRVFDVCDIAKDIYGVVLGNAFVFYVLEDGKNMSRCLHLNKKTIKEYFSDPVTILFYEYLFVLLFLIISSTLSEFQYIGIAFLLPAGIFLLIWLIIHLLQFKLSRIIILSILGIAVLGFIVSVGMNYKKNITYNAYGITVYRGIPIPYLDVMIFDNGSFRLVDKKHSFTTRDQKTILSKCTDILLIGSGEQGLGGKGFPEKRTVQFVYNPNLQRMTQVIILRTPEACRLYNRLKKENKNVTFIIHNTC